MCWGAIWVLFVGNTHWVYQDDDHLSYYCATLHGRMMLYLRAFSILRVFACCSDLQKGTKAPQAAGKIHTDFEKGFIMAEVMKFTDFKEEGTEAAVKVRPKLITLFSYRCEGLIEVQRTEKKL